MMVLFFRCETFPRKIPPRVKLFLLAAAGLKPSVNLNPAGKTECVLWPLTRLATCDEIFNSPAPSTQETKRLKPGFLFNAGVMFYLNFSVASATTAQSTHKM